MVFQFSSMSAAKLDFHRPAVARIRHEVPYRGRAGLERGQILQIERGDKAVGVNPDPDAFDKNMAVHGKIRVEIGAEGAVIF